jgi:hypothetical protein
LGRIIIYLPERLYASLEDVKVRMGLKVSGPDEVTVDRPELLAGGERAHQLKILVKGLLRGKIHK